MKIFRAALIIGLLAGLLALLTRVGAIVKELAVAPLCLLLSPVD